MDPQYNHESFNIDDYQMDSDLWYDDGNVHVRAETTIFRVHRSILAGRSRFFRDLFDKNSNRPSREIQGHPLTLFEKDGDVKLMLLAIYNLNFMPNPLAKMELNTAVSMLHLGFTYKIGLLFELALKHLSSLFPTSLEKWDNSSAASVIFPSSDEDLLSALLQIVVYTANARTWWPLPAVLYSCCTHSLIDIVKTDIYKKKVTEHQRECVITIHDGQTGVGRRMYSFLGHISAEGCQSKVACREIARKWYLESLDWRCNNPLERLSRAGRHGKYLRALCVSCFNACRRRHEEGRKTFWKALPAMVLGGEYTWDILRADEKEVLGNVEAFLSPPTTEKPPSSSVQKAIQDGRD